VTTERSGPAADGAEHAGDERAKAMARAGRLLAARPRSSAELRARLERAEFGPATVDATVERLIELGLVDDRNFARQWVEERSRAGRGPVALRHELAAKGVDREVAEDALGAVAGDELSTATALAAKHLRRVGGSPLRTQAARLAAMLARRGYPPEVCEEAVRAVLPPEGWD
jgi:regulatory protein